MIVQKADRLKKILHILSKIIQVAVTDSTVCAPGRKDFANPEESTRKPITSTVGSKTEKLPYIFFSFW